jgi:two-component system, NtrC family, response regulator GlrR
LGKQVNRFSEAKNNGGEVVSMAKILILDECPTTRNLLAEELAGEGNVVVSTGKAELILEEVVSFTPDVAIFDSFGGGTYRWALWEEVKKQTPDLPIIICSEPDANGHPHLTRNEGFIMKRFDFNEIKECISAILTQPDLAVSM